MERVQVLLSREERVRIARKARLEGSSMSAWIRQAALERLAASAARRRLDSRAALRSFFGECDERERGREPDWSEHLEVMRRSRAAGGSET